MLLGVLCLPSLAWAAPLDDARALSEQKHYAEASVILKKLVTDEPQNAQAWYLLGIATFSTDGSDGADHALPMMEKAAKLAPQDAQIQEQYGEVCLAYAGKHTSIPTALRGRDALDNCLKIDPNNLTAREVLYNYYTMAPWPIGSSGKAATQLEQIRKRDAARAQAIVTSAKINTKHYAEAFALCDETLAKNPQDANALVQYGFAAVLSGQNTERGISCLQNYLAVTPPPPRGPAPTFAWHWIGNLQERLKHRDGARVAYEQALKLDPTNHWASEGLARLNEPEKSSR